MPTIVGTVMVDDLGTGVTEFAADTRVRDDDGTLDGEFSDDAAGKPVCERTDTRAPSSTTASKWTVSCVFLFF